MHPITSSPSPSSSLEALENRIAPAGVVLVDYNPATGVLLRTGDAAANAINIYPTGPGTHRIEGIGTDLSTGGAIFDFGKLTVVDFSGGDDLDDLSLFDLSLADLTFDGGNASDSLFARDLTVKGDVSIFGAAGSDEATFAGAFTSIGRDLYVATDEGIEVILAADKTRIAGSLIGVGGTGSFSVAAEGLGSLTIGRGVEIQADLGSVSVIFSPSGLTTIGKLSSGESVLFDGGPIAETIRFSNGPVTLAGGISLTGGGGFKTVDFEIAKHNAKIGRLPSGHSILVTGDGAALITISALNFTAAGGVELVVAGGSNDLDIQTPEGKTAIGKLRTGQSLLFTAGTGNDALRVNAGNLVLAGGIEFAANSGNNTLDVSGANGTARIGKFGSGTSLLYSGGSGSDSASFDFASAVFAGGISFGGGDGSNAIEFDLENGRLTLGKLTNGASLDYLGGSNADAFEAGGGKVVFLGGVKFTGDDGTNYIDFSAAGATTTIGRLPGGHSILYSGGAGNDDIFFGSNAATLAGGIEFGAGNGSNLIEFHTLVSARLGVLPTGQSIFYTGGTGPNELSLSGNSITLRGSIELSGDTGNDRITLDGPSTNVGKSPSGVSILLDGAAGSDRLNLNGAVLLAGGINFFGGAGDDSLTSDEDGTLAARGPILFDGGLDRDRLTLESALLQLGSTLTFLGGDGRDEARIIANGFIAGDVDLDIGGNATANREIIVASDNRIRGLTLRGNLDIAASGTTTETLELLNVVILKNLNAVLSDGNSTARIENLSVSGSLSLNTGDGADQIDFEREPFFGTSVIGKLATIITGGGDDTLLIGTPLTSAVPPFPDPTCVRFLGGLSLDGGTGSNSRNDIEAENDFPGGAPTGLDTFGSVIP